MKKRPSPYKKNPSASRHPKSIPQVELFEAPTLAVSQPACGTLDHMALQMLMAGRAITTPDFQALTGSWRLAACVERLKNLHGWPVRATDESAKDGKRRRVIARYFLPSEVIEQSKGGAPA